MLWQRTQLWRSTEPGFLQGKSGIPAVSLCRLAVQIRAVKSEIGYTPMTTRTLICALLIAVPVIADGPPTDSQLKSLYESGRWTDLIEALQGHKGPALYRGALAGVFNEDRVAERLLRSVI